MRILHMMGSLGMGGSQTMVMALYRAIDRNKVQFDFIIDNDSENVFEEEIAKLGGKIFRFPKFNGKNYLEIREIWKQFFIEHPEYNVLHSHVRSYASLYIPIAKSFGVKTIIHSHNTSNGKGVTALVKKVLQYPLRFQADYFFGCSEIAGQWLFGEKIVKSSRYFMLKNAVDTERFSYQQSVREQIRQKLDVDDETILIGHVGRMHPQKNHDFLVDLFKQLTLKKDNVKLILLGDGELRDDISQKIQQLGLQDKVLLLGMQKDVERYFSAMDYLVLPSLHEGLPVVIVEAQANGLKCFVSDTITKEVQVSDLVKYLPIDQGEDIWVEEILSCSTDRKSVTDRIKSSGFCVKESSKWLCDFYSQIVG